MASAVDQYETFAWHSNEKEVSRRVLAKKKELKEEDIDDEELYQDELIKEIESHENNKGADTVHGENGHHKQFEWCLVCEHDTEKDGNKPSEEVKMLIASLSAARLTLHHYLSITGTEYYIKVSSHDKEMLQFAEQMELPIRLKPLQMRDHKGRVIKDGGPRWYGGVGLHSTLYLYQVVCCLRLKVNGHDRADCAVPECP